MDERFLTQKVMRLTTDYILTCGASPGLAFLVHRTSEGEAIFQGEISIVVAGAARGEVGTGRYPVRSPPRSDCCFAAKDYGETFGNRFGIVWGSFWDRFGIVLG